MRYKHAIFCLVAVFLIAGCATQQVDFEDGVTDNIDAQHEEWQHFFVFGLVPPKQTVSSDEYCDGNDIARVETEQTFLNGLVNGVTYGLYAPMTLRVYCKSQLQGPAR